jgi:predicted transcriptional regulator
MFKADISQIDRNTGELREGVIVLCPTKRKLKGDFVLLDLQGMGALAMDKDLQRDDWRVIAILIKRLEYENWLIITQQEIADQLGMRQPNVARSLKKLIDKAIIVKGKKQGRVNSYRLNAFYGWRGEITKEYDSAYEEHSKLVNFPYFPTSS